MTKIDLRRDEFVFRGQFRGSDHPARPDDPLWLAGDDDASSTTTTQSLLPHTSVDTHGWQPCHACGVAIPVALDERAVGRTRRIERLGTMTYVCPHCWATQVGSVPDHSLFEPQIACHVCTHPLADAHACPSCGMLRYWTLVRCWSCRARQAVEVPHLSRMCDLYTLECVACRSRSRSLCIC